VSDGVCSDKERDEIDAAAVVPVDDAIPTVLAAPAASPDELDRDVYADQPGATTATPTGGDEQEMTFREALNLALDQALGAHAVLREQFRGGERLDHAAPVADQRDVVAGALDVGVPERDREGRVGRDRPARPEPFTGPARSAPCTTSAPRSA
jgi:hypothetical protein